MKEKKKIAILTQPLGHNYGGLIQNFALKSVLEKNGYHVETVNRIDENPHSKFKRLLSSWKDKILKIIRSDFITKKDQKLIFAENLRFIKEHIFLSEKIETTRELKLYFQKNTYDAVIVGSDQTWRPKYSPNIYDYFLEFIQDNKTIKKIAYASSFGTSEWEFTPEETERCKTLVNQFDAISVRERSGVDLCRDHLEVEATWTLDPTLLLNKEDYLAVANVQNIPPRKGVFSYILDENEANISVIEEITSVLGTEHFTNQPKWRKNDKTGQKLEDLQYPSLEGWLKAFDQADFVITDSFHGTVFSIIFNKPFLTIVNKERGASRFYSLLNELGLGHRIVEEGEKNISKIVEDSVDFAWANKRLKEMKEKSLIFLLRL